MEPVKPVKIHLKSSAFDAGETIPEQYTCDGDDVNPGLELDNIPAATVSLAILMEDPDAPSGTWTHWLAWNIPPSQTIEENSAEGVLGKNDFGTILYQGPCPPMGTHRYFFRVYALDIKLDLPAGSTREQMLKALEFHVIGSGELMGLYSKK
ncbi:YbhB/YbcL family Raf kinase inhibitor-like protein [Pontibacter pudoricolor]|uniref:YbhB/YbcL family Raf kinase inhibitor-like protein n=1 Tax=Pontibacter pudoricolor TaxID=2694930 RepID=UPI001390D370|nr:YbhB/YbcL family Raf kinase inhibitor-like protein [Pontibacter pudoricolor]